MLKSVVEFLRELAIAYIAIGFMALSAFTSLWVLKQIILLFV